MNDGHKVLSELSGVVLGKVVGVGGAALLVGRGLRITRVDHQGCSTGREDELQQLNTDASDAVSVGDHNLLNVSSDALLYQGAKTGAVEVNS